MNELLTAAQMRAIEEAAISAGAVTGLELMERAGAGVVAAVMERWPDLGHGGHSAVVLCGPGNNGGDGFVVARLLRARGWDVAVFLHGDAARLPPDARVNCERWSALGAVHPVAEFDAGRATGAALIFDALFGTGLARPVEGRLAELFRDLWRRGRDGRPAIVAIDLPSGIGADSGRVLGQAMPADLVVTFHAAKLGHHLAEGPGLAASVIVKDIGLGDAAPSAAVRLFSPADTDLRDALGKGGEGRIDGSRHKYDHGHALVLSGPAGRGGAARLAARGALRVGAGVVTLGCPPDALGENAARMDAVMLRPVADAAALAEVLEDARITAICLGPALGTGPREAGLVAAALAAPRATVLDADALTLLARDGALSAALHGPCVLTPHAGEFARLFPDIAARLEAEAAAGPAYSKVDAVRAAAARAGCVVLLKGPDTVIAAPDGRCAVNSAQYDRAAPWLATAGSGDVLAGFVAGLMARGLAGFEAACMGAWLHVEAARAFGPGLIAEDLPEALPAVFRRLGM